MKLVTDVVGDAGKFQIWICFLIFLSKFGAGFHMMAIVFLAPPMKYTCPGKAACCDNPNFDTTNYTRTITMEFNLTCDRAWLKDLTQGLFQLGVLLGCLICGIISDRFGRRKTLLVCVILEMITGLIIAFLPDIWSFTVIRMILGFSVGGIMVVGYILLIEYVGIKYRPVVAALFHVPFTLAHILLSLLGGYIKDYVYFQLGISVSTLILLIYICCLPESPRWLLAANRTTEAIATLERIAKANNLPLDPIQQKVDEFLLEQGTVKQGSFLDLFAYPNLRTHILLMIFMWLICSYSFFGVSQYIFLLTFDVNINVLTSGVICLLATLIAIPLMQFLSRKLVIITAGVLCTLCLLIIAFVPEGYGSIGLGCFGLFCSFTLFVVGYLFCAEMFPTVVRNTAMGLAAAVARVGAATAPLLAGLRVHCTWCVPVVFCLFPLIAAILCIFLPETKGIELMTTIEEGEDFGKKPPQANAPDSSTT